MSTLSVAADDVLAVGPREQRLSWPLATSVAALPFVVAGVSALAAHAGYWGWFAEEDGPCENLQFLLLIVAAAVAGAVAVARRRRGDRLLAVLYWVLAIGLVGMAGEEISWGQRLFGIATPAALAEHNLQGELNLHNTFLMTDVMRLGQLVVGLLLAVILVIPWPRHLHGGFVGTLLPHPALAPYFGMTGVWRLYRMVTGGHSDVPWVPRYAEVVELMLYFGILLFVLMQLAAVRSLDRHSA